MSQDIQQWAKKISERDTRSLAKAMTLSESDLAQEQEQFNQILSQLTSAAKNSPCLSIAITGHPGAGKSTFIESFGMALLSEKFSPLAILAVDPSSPLAGGSILGDKTRMQRLAQRDDVFIRPSPSLLHLGGLSPGTPGSLALCQSAGFRVILLETVGVGQSEVEADQLADLVIYVTAPGAGDDLQGIKRGVLETADYIVINKNDGSLMQDAERLYSSLKDAMKLTHPRVKEIRKLSSLNDQDTGACIDWIRSFNPQDVRAEFKKRRHALATRLLLQNSLRYLREDAEFKKIAEDLAEKKSQTLAQLVAASYASAKDYWASNS